MEVSVKGDDEGVDGMAKFCSECGAAVEGMKFCAECGTGVERDGTATAVAVAANGAPSVVIEEAHVWSGAPDPLLSPVAAKTTKYAITTERLTVDAGLVGRRSDSLDLFRVKDVNVSRTLKQRARGRGDVTVTSTDPSTPHFVLESISDPESVAMTLRGLVREARSRHGVTTRELM